MKTVFSWMKSTRSIAVIIFAVGIHVGLFLGIIDPAIYGQALMLVFGAYFAKRDEFKKED